MRLTLLILTVILFLGCSPQLKFSLRNSTNISIKEIKVVLPDTTLYFATLNSLSNTNWINVRSAYSYGHIKFKDNNSHQFELRPIDYVGERLYKKGFMTFIIESIDTTTQRVHLSFSTQKDITARK